MNTAAVDTHLDVAMDQGWVERVQVHKRMTNIGDNLEHLLPAEWGFVWGDQPRMKRAVHVF